MAVYGYARVSRGREDGTYTLQNQRMRLTGAGVDAAHIHQDIITGTVMQRPGLNDLLEVIRPGDVLVVTALDRLGRDTLGLLELINRLATMGVDLKVLDMPVDAQDVAGGGQLVALVTAGVAAIERANISRRTKQGLERARAEGKLAGRCWSISRARMRTIHWMRKDPGMSLAQTAQGQGVSESLVRRVLKVEDVEALPATAFKEGWDQVVGEAGRRRGSHASECRMRLRVLPPPRRYSKVSGTVIVLSRLGAAESVTGGEPARIICVNRQK